MKSSLALYHAICSLQTEECHNRHLPEINQTTKQAIRQLKSMRTICEKKENKK